MKLAVQCDFDGTITEEDVSFLLADAFASDRWRGMLEEYMAGKIPVGTFNRRVFAMVKADEATQLDLVFNSGRVKIRPGLKEMIDYCRAKEYKFIIVSNGLTFYIKAILEKLGIDSVEVFAARNEFHPEGTKVSYISPDGEELDAGFKEAYTRLLQHQGYDVAYVGNGVSDIFSSRMAFRVFATGDLLRKCREEKLECIPFNDLFDVIRGLEDMSE